MRLKLLQWNVWFKESADNILRMLREVNADILCLQELTTTSAFNIDRDIPSEIAEELGLHSVYKIAQQWDAPEDKRTLGNGIFSRFPVTRGEVVFVQQPTPNTTDFSKEGRTYVEADLVIDGRTLTVGTTHLSYTHRFRLSEPKKREVDHLVASLKRHRKNFLFSGDLNAKPGTYTVKRIAQHLKHCGPPYRVATWTSKPFEYQGFSANAVRWRLDYVFSTPDIRIVSARVVETEYSDHLPVLVEVEW